MNIDDDLVRLVAQLPAWVKPLARHSILNLVRGLEVLGLLDPHTVDLPDEEPPALDAAG